MSKAGSTRFEMFAVSQPGLERTTAMELAAMGVRCSPGVGGVNFHGGLKELYRTNLWLRSANRILVRVGRFRITELSELIPRLSRYPWELYGIRAVVPTMRVTSHKSRLYHTGAVAQRALEGIARRAGPLYEAKWPEQQAPLVVIRLVRDVCTVSIDSSGAPLHMRGYRVMGVRAPLRENLAAGLVLMSGWHRDMPFLDPFCGSGTIAIEAAMISRNMAPGLNRKFAFMQWRNFDSDLWQSLRADAMRIASAEQQEGYGVIYASDAHIRAVEAAGANADAAGVGDYVVIEQAVCSRATLRPCPRPGWIITNPPYGRRVSALMGQKQDIYREIALAVQADFASWGITCLTPSYRANPLPGVKVQTITTFRNGGLRVKVVERVP